MAENLKITTEGTEKASEFGRAFSEKLQHLSRQLVSSLYMLVRSVKLYEPENSIFAKPIELLRETISQIIAKEGQLVLQIVKESFYLNNMLVKVDIQSLENVRELIREFRDRKIGGLTLARPVNAEELRNFIFVFAKSEAAVAEDGVEGRKLLTIRMVRWAEIQEKLKGVGEVGETDGQKVDRKKYAMTVYARLIFFLRRYLDGRKAGKPLSTARAGRLVQDMVDICFEQHSHFLGMTTLRDEADYLVYHSVNVCLLCIVFGAELGLGKQQLRDLAMAALFHDIGKADLPPGVADKPGALTPQDREQIAKSQLASVKAILGEGLSRESILRLVTAFEFGQDFGTPVKDANGATTMVLPSGSLGVFSRILAICDAFDALTSRRPYRDPYGPDVALLLMWTEMRQKFDPELLKVFMKVMAIQPIKILPKQTVAVG